MFFFWKGRIKEAYKEACNPSELDLQTKWDRQHLPSFEQTSFYLETVSQKQSSRNTRDLWDFSFWPGFLSRIDGREESNTRRPSFCLPLAFFRSYLNLSLGRRGRGLSLPGLRQLTVHISVFCNKTPNTIQSVSTF